MNKEKIYELAGLIAKREQVEQEMKELIGVRNCLEYDLTKIFNSKTYKKWRMFNTKKEHFIKLYLRPYKKRIKMVLKPLNKLRKKLLTWRIERQCLKNFKKVALITLYDNRKESVLRQSPSIVSMPRVSIMIPTFGNTANLDRLLKSIIKHLPKTSFEILIANDDPRKLENIKTWIVDKKDLLQNLPIYIHSNSLNLGFVMTMNYLKQQAKGQYLYFLNDDTEMIKNGWLDQLHCVVEKDKKIAIVGSLLLFPNGLVQHAGMYPYRRFDDRKIYNLHYFKFFNPDFSPVKISRQVPMITGASMLISKKVFEEVGGIDYHYLGAGGFDDSDLCNKVVKAGYKIYYAPLSSLIHHEGLTNANLTDLQRKQLIFNHNHNYYMKKWATFLARKYPEYV